jgi:hypothetical protein
MEDKGYPTEQPLNGPKDFQNVHRGSWALVAKSTPPFENGLQRSNLQKLSTKALGRENLEKQSLAYCEQDG